jgi:hypothetical protein
LDFKIISHPKATIVSDDIFRYLVIEYGNSELSWIDVFTCDLDGQWSPNEKYNIRTFVNWNHFEKEMPNVSSAIKKEWEEFRRSV